MRNFSYVLLKSILWLLIVLLLRPVNFLLDWSLGAFFKCCDKTEDMSLNRYVKIVGVTILVLLVICVSIYLFLTYGKFVS